MLEVMLMEATCSSMYYATARHYPLRCEHSITV